MGAVDEDGREPVSDEGARLILAEAIQQSASTDDDLEGAVLMGWVLVAEFMAPSGQRWLSKVDGTVAGTGCPEWQSQGYLHNALFRPEGFGRDEESGE